MANGSGQWFPLAQGLSPALLLIGAVGTAGAAFGQDEALDFLTGDVPPQAAAAERPSAEDAPPAKPDAPLRRPRPLVAIEEIVVTAQKRAESINDVPIAISAFTGDDLEALGMADTRDLSKLVPGFTASESGFNTPVYTLRGVGFNDTSYTASSTVGVYVDEVSMPFSIMTKGAALDLERVEVLKGPQGILYGRNTTGGAINYIAKKPSDSFETGISAGYGRFMTSEVDAYVSGPLTDSLKARLAVKDLRSQQGWQYSHTRPDDTLGKQDKQSLRGILDWQALDDLSFRLAIEGWRDRSEPRAGQVIAIQEQSPNDPAGVFLPPQARDYPLIPRDGADPQAADWPSSSVEPFIHWQLNDYFLQESLRADWQIGETTQLTAIAAQNRVDSVDSTFPQSGFNFDNTDTGLTAHIETTALELRLSGLLADADIDWMVGGNATKDRGYENLISYIAFQSAAFPDPVTGRSTVTDKIYTIGRPQMEQLAGFVNLGWRFAETFKLSTGVRYTEQNQTFTACSGWPEDASGTLGTVVGAVSVATAAQYAMAHPGETGDPTPIINKGDCFTVAENGSTDPYQGKLDEHNLSYRLALDWKPADDYLFYVSYAQGYKAGGFPILTATLQSEFEPVSQEQLRALELGSKTSFFDRQLHTNLALYYYDYKDKQLLTKLLDPNFGPLPVLKNAPKSRVFGAEVDLQYAPAAIEGLFLTATGAYADTEILEFGPQDDARNNRGDETDFAGKPFNFAPRLQYTLVANYSFPVSENLLLTTGADWYYSGSTNSTLEEDPLFAMRAYGLIGARLGMAAADRHWSLTAYGRNLSNELYEVTLYNYGDGVTRQVGLPRTYGMVLTYDWF